MFCTKFKDIPDDLIVEILKRLPVKSLLRLMSVCKSLYSIIKNPNFISCHFNYQRNQGPTYLLYRNAENPGNYYVYEDTDSFDRQLEFGSPEMNYELGCCNGIVCFDISIDNSFVLWNSYLRKSLDIKVPHCDVDDDEKWAFWFGFDEVLNDYKLVWVRYAISESWETRFFAVYIYSLNERTWRCVNPSFVLDDGYLIGVSQGVYLNGVIHWVAERHYDDRYMPELILGFSLVDETFCVFKLPCEIAYEVFDYDHSRYGGYLVPEDRVDLITVKRGCKDCLVAIHDDSINFNFWVMEEEGIQESWRNEFFVSKDCIKRILNVRTNGDIVMERKGGDVISFDHMLMSINILSSENMDYVGTYMENLVLL